MALSHSTTTKQTFKHLTAYNCGKIAVLHAEGKSMQAIANAVGCHKSTISRELKRGAATQMISDRKTFQSYFPSPKQESSSIKRNEKSEGRKLNWIEPLFTESKILHDQWSPDAVCGYVKQHGLFEGETVYTKTLLSPYGSRPPKCQKHQLAHEASSQHKEGTIPPTQTDSGA